MEDGLSLRLLIPGSLAVVFGRHPYFQVYKASASGRLCRTDSTLSHMASKKTSAMMIKDKQLRSSSD